MRLCSSLFIVCVVQGGSVVRHAVKSGKFRVRALTRNTKDDKAKRAENRVMLSVYGRLRPQAVRHVEEAVPGLARLVQTHVG